MLYESLPLKSSYSAKVNGLRARADLLRPFSVIEVPAEIFPYCLVNITIMRRFPAILRCLSTMPSVLIIIYSSLYPQLRIVRSESLQFSLTLTQRLRYTLQPSRSSMSRLAALPTPLSLLPPLPIMIDLWDFFSQ